SALALMVALAIDPHASTAPVAPVPEPAPLPAPTETAEPIAEAAPPIGAGPAAPVAAPEQPVSATSDPPTPDRITALPPAEEPRWRWGVGAGALALAGVFPGVASGGFVLGDVERVGAGDPTTLRWSPTARVAVTRTLPHTLGDAYTARFVWTFATA